VPLDGVSDGSAAYVFFSTGYTRVAGKDLMHRSVVTRCVDDLQNFEYLGTFSGEKFVNVSVQRGSVPTDMAGEIGLLEGTDVLWIWGSGRYRASDVYLGVLPFTDLSHAARGQAELHPRYLAGPFERRWWSPREEDAVPLFCGGSVGELSVRWQPTLGRYLLTYNGDNPRGIQLHTAPQPWGPWRQRPISLFEPGRDGGYGVFMHRKDGADFAYDAVLPPFKDRTSEWGGEYGPYQVAHLTTPTHDGALVYFAMSTWTRIR
jgi:hypothetical protein